MADDKAALPREIDPRSAIADKMAAAFPTHGVAYTRAGIADALCATLDNACTGYGGRHVVAVYAFAVPVGVDVPRLGIVADSIGWIPLGDAFAILRAADLDATIAKRRVAFAIGLQTPEACVLTRVLPPLGQCMPASEIAALDVVAIDRAEWIVTRTARGATGVWLRLRRLDTTPRDADGFTETTRRFAPDDGVYLRHADYRKRPPVDAVETARR